LAVSEAPPNEPLRVFVGSESKQWLSAEVLRYSIARRTSARLDFQDLRFLPLKERIKFFGGFFIHRFAVPELCGFCGKAIYLDADVIVLDDLLRLLHRDMEGSSALACPVVEGHPEAGRYTSVMLLDCEKLSGWKLEEWVEKMGKDPSAYTKTLKALPGGFATDDFGDLPSIYNQRGTFDETTKIFHYSHIPVHTQMDVGPPFSSLFISELKSAIYDEEIPLGLILKEIELGHVNPLLLKELV
jgi:hypothetical protein